MSNAEFAKAELARKKAEMAHDIANPRIPGRRLVSLAVRPGIALYVGNCTYPESLHAERHKRLRMWDVGPYALIQAVDADGEVIDEIEVLWHSVWWRKLAK